MVLHLFSRSSVKDSGKGKYSQRAEICMVHIVVHIACKEKWPDVELYTDSQPVANGQA